MKKLKPIVIACTLCVAFTATPGFSQGSQNGEDGISVPASSVSRPKQQPRALAADAASEPMVSIEILPTSGLSTASPNYISAGGNKANIMNGLTGTVVPTDRSVNPAAWYQIDYRRFIWGDMVLSSGFNSFTGTNNPSGAFAGEFGNRHKWCMRMKTTNGVPFSANMVWYNILSSTKSTDPVDLNLSGNLATNSLNGSEIKYQFILQGLWYGSDGVKGGGDDVWYNSDSSQVSSDALVDELYYFGVTSSLTASTPSGLASAKNILTVPGFFMDAIYYLKVGDHTNGWASATLRTAPKLAVMPGSEGGTVIHVFGQPQTNYRLQHTLDLDPPVVWTTIPGTFVNGTDFPMSFALPEEFFRLVTP